MPIRFLREVYKTMKALEENNVVCYEVPRVFFEAHPAALRFNLGDHPLGFLKDHFQSLRDGKASFSYCNGEFLFLYEEANQARLLEFGLALLGEIRDTAAHTDMTIHTERRDLDNIALLADIKESLIKEHPECADLDDAKRTFYIPKEITKEFMQAAVSVVLKGFSNTSHGTPHLYWSIDTAKQEFTYFCARGCRCSQCEEEGRRKRQREELIMVPLKPAAAAPSPLPPAPAPILLPPAASPAAPVQSPIPPKMSYGVYSKLFGAPR